MVGLEVTIKEGDDVRADVGTDDDDGDELILFISPRNKKCFFIF